MQFDFENKSEYIRLVSWILRNAGLHDVSIAVLVRSICGILRSFSFVSVGTGEAFALKCSYVRV